MGTKIKLRISADLLEQLAEQGVITIEDECMILDLQVIEVVKVFNDSKAFTIIDEEKEYEVEEMPSNGPNLRVVR